MVVRAYPKLNIFLKILGSQGHMHLLNSRFVMAFGGLYDEIEIVESDSFSLKGEFGCPTEENLIYKAKEALKKNIKDSKMLDCLSVEVNKKIPQGAGLGGGSSNAGAFLLEVDRMFGLSLGQDLLNEIAIRVGSDVVFFVNKAYSANVSGIGECVEEYIEDKCDFEIYTPPNIKCNTSEVYGAFDRSGCNKNFDSDMLDMKSVDILKKYDPYALNDLFAPASILYPDLLEIHKELGDEWFFSGSGSSFFRIKK